MNNWPSLLFICINESRIADPTTKTSLLTNGPKQNISRQLRDPEQAIIPSIHTVTSQQWKQQYRKGTTRESETHDASNSTTGCVPTQEAFVRERAESKQAACRIPCTATHRQTGRETSALLVSCSGRGESIMHRYVDRSLPVSPSSGVVRAPRTSATMIPAKLGRRGWHWRVGLQDRFFQD